MKTQTRRIILFVIQGTDRLFRGLFLLLILLYRNIISPFLPSSCIFTPSCSEYARLALKKYSLFHALFLIIWRIFRCNPFNRGGYDPLK